MIAILHLNLFFRIKYEKLQLDSSLYFLLNISHTSVKTNRRTQLNWDFHVNIMQTNSIPFSNDCGQQYSNYPRLTIL